MEKKWYVYYTKSRHEKKVKELLERRGYDVFLPIQKVLRQWTDRKKKVEVPLFNSYIFVRTEEHHIVQVLQVPGISWNIRHNDKPAILRPKEYDLINRFLATGLTLEVVATPQVAEGDRVEVVDGPLKGAVGKITSGSDCKFMVSLDTLGQSIKVQLDPIVLRKY